MDVGGISAVVFAILFLVIGSAYAHKLWTEGAFSGSIPRVELGFLSLMVLYLPNTLFAYGFIADLMNSSYHYSAAGITALIGMTINKVIGGPVVDGIVSALSFAAVQFSKLPVAAQAVIGAVGVGAAAAAVPAAAAAANPFAAAVPAAAAAANPFAAAVPAAAVAANPFAAAVPAAAAALPEIVAPGVAAAAAAPVVAAAANPFRQQMETEQAEAAAAAREEAAERRRQQPGANPFLGGRRKQRGGATNMCSLPGFEWLENTVAPQGIVMSMTVLWYLLIELWDTGRTSQSIALGVVTGIVFLLQGTVLHKNNCLASYKYGIYSILISLVMAITFASSSYFIQKTFLGHGASGGAPVPPTPTPTGPKCPDGTVMNSDGTMCLPVLGGASSRVGVGAGGPSEKSAPVNDDDQFVCEAYKDGELVTSTIVE